MFNINLFALMHIELGFFPVELYSLYSLYYPRLIQNVKFENIPYIAFMVHHSMEKSNTIYNM